MNNYFINFSEILGKNFWKLENMLHEQGILVDGKVDFKDPNYKPIVFHFVCQVFLDNHKKLIIALNRGDWEKWLPNYTPRDKNRFYRHFCTFLRHLEKCLPIILYISDNSWENISNSGELSILVQRLKTMDISEYSFKRFKKLIRKYGLVGIENSLSADFLKLRFF